MGIPPLQLTRPWIREFARDLLKDRRLKLTSRQTWDYNCIGLVVGDFLWWHPEISRDYYWPEEIPRNYWLKTYLTALATVGFSECRNHKFTQGFQVAAVYAAGGLFKHIATQIAPDVWKSKLGDYEDLEHSLKGIEGRGYGKFSTFIVRPAPPGYGEMPPEYLI